MQIVTVPDLYSNPMEAIAAGLAIKGIPNTWMLDKPYMWHVVAYVEGEDFERSSQQLTDWITENGEPDNATLLKGE